MFQPYRKKKFIFLLIMVSVPFLFIECLTRGYFAIRVGPSVLLYGTMFSRHQEKFDPIGTNRKKGSVGNHGNIIGNYSKYYPHQKRVDRDEFGKTFRVKINARGFRGKNFEQKKQPGVIRIVTLGASSTFGFHDRDNETYPFYLEKRLNALLPTVNAQRNTQSLDPIRAFEVINLGIPHLTTDKIYSLFVAEALDLNPDIVTFYEGINDAWRIARRFIDGDQNPTQVEKLTLAKKIYAEFRYRFLSIAWFESFASRYINVPELSVKKYDAYLQHQKGAFVEILQHIHRKSLERGMVFIVANQQAKSYIMARERMEGITYAQERRIVKEKWAANDTLRPRGKLKHLFYFRTHSQLMEDLQHWAKTNFVPFVDVIAAMDLHRQNLITWVHLTPQGNRIVASAFATEILKQVRDRPINTRPVSIKQEHAKVRNSGRVSIAGLSS